MRKTNIINIATSDQGGAGIASVFFNEFCNRDGYRSVLLVKDSNSNNINVINLDNIIKYYVHRILTRIRNEYKKIFNVVRNDVLFGEKYFFFNDNEGCEQVTAKQIINMFPYPPDIIVFHWVSNFINAKIINELSKLTSAKMFWIMMDNAPLTGGCHYPWDCKGYYDYCGDCPAILNESNKSIAKNNLNFKKNNLPGKLEIIACSEQDFNRASNSALFRDHVIHKFLFPVDSNKFMPSDSSFAKYRFGISAGKKVIFYGASSVNNIRKGVRLFIESLIFLQDILINKNISLDGYVVLVAGNYVNNVFDEIMIPIIYTGYLSEEDLVIAYQSAEVFVSSSVEDSGPIMVNQSIMAGTPVVAFNIGVANDIVHLGVTGYLATLYDCRDMANCIYKLLVMDNDKYLNIRKNCRTLALEKFSNGVASSALKMLFAD